jgi:predicted ATPase
MASRRNKPINLPAPYLKRIWLEPSRIANREAYPFCLPLLRDDFELSFDKAITIIVGENGTGKSTFLKASPCSPATTKPAAARAT